MRHFTYRNDKLFSENTDIGKITKKINTPFYCYSLNAIKENINNFKNNTHNINAKLCFALKANSNLTILSEIAKEGFGADVVSKGEFKKALKSGIKSDNIVFSGVGKSYDEIKFAIQEKCFQINAESISEIKKINEISGNLKLTQNIAIRINPNVTPDTHSKITTGSLENKFGITIEEAIKVFDQASLFKNINIIGIAFHIGSQIMEIDPFEKACIAAKKMIEKIESTGSKIKTIDVGGGIGISEKNEFQFVEYFKMIQKYFDRKDDLQVILEPGRTILGNAGIVVSKVLYIKETKTKNFAIIDAGMNDFIRPALYDAQHPIIPLIKKDNKKKFPLDVVGPICESSDKFLSTDEFQELNEGDYIAILNTGAYGSSMSSNYNVRPLIEEILINNDQFYIIKKIQTFEEIIMNETNL